MQPSRLSARGKPPEANNWEAGSLRLCDGHSQVSRLHLGTVLSPGTPRREAFPRKEMAFLFRVHFFFSFLFFSFSFLKFSVATVGGRGRLVARSR
jgi:hypothetical protein